MSLQSENINELMGALAKAQGEMEGALADSSNPHFKSKYPDLASVWQACRLPLSKNGLSVTQSYDLAGERIILVTTLGHSSGQWMKSIVPLPVVKPGSQEIGSCTTYMRRYSLAAMVGIYQDDDDGEKTDEEVQGALTDKQKSLLKYKLSQYPDVEKILIDTYKLKNVYDLNRKQFQLVMEGFQKKDLATKGAQ